MNPLARPEYDPALPLQTEAGAQQGLRVEHNRIKDLSREKRLKVVYFGRSRRITTKSILEVAEAGINDAPPRTQPKKHKASGQRAASEATS